MFPDLSIIVVNWNLLDDTIECIDSLLKAGASLNQIIIVDNGSTDGSITGLRDYYQAQIFIITVKENIGYAAGANLGIQYALTQNYEWLLLLNNDTIVAADFIKNMYQATQNNNGYSILTPIIFYQSNPSIIWYQGERQIGNTLLTIDKYKNRKIKQNLPKFFPIDFTNGCAMLVSRKVFEKIGFLDESFFMYGEEVDFCWRARLDGFKFACYTPAHIWHKISKSSQGSQPMSRYLRIRNQIYFYKRYTHGFEILTYFVFTLIRTVKLCIIDLLKGHITLIPPSILGWSDGWFDYPPAKNN